jgi:hypothetical protein
VATQNLDSETAIVTAPVVYCILPRALKVVVPKPPPASREMRGAPAASEPAGQI